MVVMSKLDVCQYRTAAVPSVAVEATSALIPVAELLSTSEPPMGQWCWLQPDGMPAALSASIGALRPHTIENKSVYQKRD